MCGSSVDVGMYDTTVLSSRDALSANQHAVLSKSCGDEGSLVAREGPTALQAWYACYVRSSVRPEA